VVGQELHFIVEVVEEHAGAELVSGDGVEVEGVLVVVAFEDDGFVGEVDPDADDVIFFELEGLC
jgi:hypothetical protein